MNSLFERDLTVKHHEPTSGRSKNKSVSETSVSPSAAYQNTAMLWNRQGYEIWKYRQQRTHSKSSLCISTTSNDVSFIQGKSKHVIGFYLYHFSSLIVFSVLGAKVWSVTSGCPSSYCVLFSVAPLVCEHGLSLAWFVCSTLF